MSKPLKSFKTLYRLAQTALDEVRQEIIQAESNRHKLEKDIEAIGLGIQQEEQLLANNLETRSTFEAFLQACRRRENEIREQIQLIDRLLESLREQLKEKYAEVKKYERVLEIRVQENDKELLDEEARFLDQIATTKYIREMDR